MRLFLVTDSKTGIDFFPKLEETLRKKVADLQVERIYAPFPEDIPGKVAEIGEEADLVFVFVLYAEKDYKIEALLNKLIDLETKTRAKIIKVIEESDVEGLTEDFLALEKEKLAEKWSKFIIDYLFKPEAFKPKENPREPGIFT